MAPQLTHTEIQQLLGAFALDAVDADEAEVVERHLVDCPRCRAEVVEHREAATMLSFTGATAPEAVWSRIAADLVESPPPLQFVRPPSPSRTPWRGMAAVAAVAAAVIGVLGTQVVTVNHRVDNLAAASNRGALAAAAAAVAVSPDARTVHLLSNDKTQSVDAVVLPDGQGYMVRSRLAKIAVDQTYQLWGVIGAQTISLGVVGRDPGVTPFKAAGALRALAITIEHRGGAVAPTTSPVVQGFVES